MNEWSEFYLNVLRIRLSGDESLSIETQIELMDLIDVLQAEVEVLKAELAGRGE